MFHYKVGSSGSVIAAEQSLSRTIGLWVDACLEQYSGALPDDNPYQSVYASAWTSWLKAQEDHRAASWVVGLRDQVDAHFTRSDQWYHGYWRKHEISRGIDHFLLFLGGLWDLDANDPVTIEMAVDLAEHLGNWNKDVPAWFDWDTGLFRSVYLGTNGAAYAEDYAYNIPAHLRALDMALLSYRMTGQSQYLELALAGATRWANAIVDSDGFPFALGSKSGLLKLPRPAATRYSEFVSARVMTGNDKGRAYLFLKEGGVQLLLKLWQYSREQLYMDAVEKTLDLLLPDIAEANTNALCAAIRFYRNHSGRIRYDDAVLQTSEYLFPYFIDSLNLENRDYATEGQRPGSVSWRENTQVRQHNPIFLGLAAEITGNERLATRALDLGVAYMELARQAFPNGRDNPMQGRSVSAVARGGAYDNGAGIITELWQPLRQRFCTDPFQRPERMSRRPFPLRLAKG